MIRIIILFTILFLGLQEPAKAYIDPGSGGYLISSLLAMIGTFFAFSSAIVIHFFRNTIGKGVKFLSGF
jgi:hypothetical protein